jgi:transcriptional regulator with XRE-family HTH domain
MADILKELASKIPWCKKRMFELHSWVVESVTLALHDKDHPITQKELAEKMGIDPASLSRSLSFKGANLTFETVGKFEEAIGRKILRTKSDVKHEIADSPSEAWALYQRSEQRFNDKYFKTIEAQSTSFNMQVNAPTLKIYNNRPEPTYGGTPSEWHQFVNS